ncbi:MAG TPA: TolC family protein [Polyangiales bacterium]|nr:TolC family protein [Polyangiales bacterium]
MSLRLVAALVAALVSISAHALAQPRAGVDALAHSERLSREAYVRAVLEENPSLEAARQGFRAAQARVRQAGAFDDPMLELSVAPLSIGSSSARLGMEVGVSQTLPWFGKRALERDAMRAEAAAAQSDLGSTRRELALAALGLYDQYYVALRSLEINASHVALVSSLRDAVTAQVQAGRGSLQDVLQAEAELTQLEREAVVLGSERDVVIAQMNELLHRNPAEPLPPPAPPPELAAAPLAPDAARLEQQALAGRAEIASAKLHARAESAKADAAERAYYPTITLSTSYSSMWDMPQHRWMIGASVNLPWPSEQRAAAVDEAHAARAQYESEAERMRSAARTEVFVALRRLQESEHVLQLYQTRLLPVARQRSEVAQASFATAQASLTSVIEAERNLRGLELDHALALAEHDRRGAELQRALGQVPGVAAQEAKP